MASSLQARIRQSVRRRLDARPRPVHVYVNLVLSGLLVTTGLRFRDGVRTLEFAGSLNPDMLTVSIAVIMLGALVIFPVLVAMLAVPTWLVCRACGGTATCMQTVTAAGWAAWLGAPVYFGAVVLGGMLTFTDWSPERMLIGGRLVELVGFVLAMWVWVQCLATANGFRRAWLMFAIVFSVAAGVALFNGVGGGVG